MGAVDLLGGEGLEKDIGSWGEKSVSEVDSLGSPGFWYCLLYCLIRQDVHCLGHTLLPTQANHSTLL